MKISEIKSLKELSMVTNLSQSEIGNLMGWSKTQTSLIASGKYEKWEEKTASAVEACVKAGKLLVPEEERAAYAPVMTTVGNLTFDSSVFLQTDNANRIFSLADGLLDPDATLNASIGMATGQAGYGKTTALRQYVSKHDDTVYILWMDYTKSQLFSRIAEELVGRSYANYLKNIKLIIEVTRAYRKLIIIDEADRMPLPILECLRTLNEEGCVPILLVGEASLTSKVKRADRIESRIRKPVITFTPLDWIELAAFWQKSTGLEISKEVAQQLCKDCHRDFRIAANDCQHIIKMMNTNGITVLDKEALDAIRRTRS